MKANTQIIKDGEEYPDLGISLCVNTVGNTVPVSFSIWPSRTVIDTGEVVELRELSKHVIFQNIMTCNDDAAQLAFVKITAAIQEYIKVKNL